MNQSFISDEKLDAFFPVFLELLERLDPSPACKTQPLPALIRRLSHRAG
jgi:hypothetical protein